jgi:hypothetical protein
MTPDRMVAHQSSVAETPAVDQVLGRIALAIGPAAETRVQQPAEGALSNSTIKARPSPVNRHDVLLADPPLGNKAQFGLI